MGDTMNGYQQHAAEKENTFHKITLFVSFVMVNEVNPKRSNFAVSKTICQTIQLWNTG
jgi:hypothetical protein